MTSFTPLPVQTLEYGSSTTHGAWRGFIRGIGLILIIVGGTAAAAQALQIGAAMLGKADPFLRGIITYSWLLKVNAGFILIESSLSIIGGIGCLRFRRWARRFLIAYALVSISARAFLSIAWVWATFDSFPKSGIDLAQAILTRIAYLLGWVCVPTILLLLTRQADPWRAE